MWVQHPYYSQIIWSQNCLVLGSRLSCYWVATSKDYERVPETSETLIYIGMIRIMVRRIA
ncbi:hypothetical protein RintRC_2950 [Richelia intracellularis]|nr:hypothetical protein RintRC_2950 [Richelia intracellularis]